MDALTCVADLRRPSVLSELLGAVRRVREEPLTTIGFSAGSHRRLTVEFEDGREESFIVKEVSVDSDWCALRTGDVRGREVALLEEPTMTEVWDCVASPYIAYAREKQRVGLLMRDLTPHLLPDVRAPLEPQQETALLSSLARLHVRFWGTMEQAPEWLARGEDYLEFVGPYTEDSPTFTSLPSELGKRIVKGWQLVARNAPKAVWSLLQMPSASLVREFMRGPRTLVHGDSKVANFAHDPHTGTVWAFDWALTGYASAGTDLGWYLCVNGSRLAESHDATIERYRACLTQQRGKTLSLSDWTCLVESAVLCGARMGLWSKAMLVENGVPNAQREWDWWIDRLKSLGSTD